MATISVVITILVLGIVRRMSLSGYQVDREPCTYQTFWCKNDPVTGIIQVGLFPHRA